MSDSFENNTIYFKLTGFKTDKYASEVIPLPTKDQVKAGKYTRYFASQKNVSKAILEIDKTQFEAFLKSEFYDVFSIEWLLPSDSEKNMELNMNTIVKTNAVYPGFKEKMRPFAMKPTQYKETA